MPVTTTLVPKALFPFEYSCLPVNAAAAALRISGTFYQNAPNGCKAHPRVGAGDSAREGPCYNRATPQSARIGKERLDFRKLMENGLPQERLALIDMAAGIAADEGTPLYLVGGAVRDLLLGRPTEDLDLVVEGDAETLAAVIAKRMSGDVVARSQFATVKLKVWGSTLDMSTARNEWYARPGALPQIAHGTMREDLARRDFSINAMAYPLHLGRGAELLDPHGGLDDLRRGLVRTLHDGSFTDDATRIMRAVRYEQRLGFALEERTESLLRRDLPMLDTISGDRLRREVQLWTEEEPRLDILARADSLGVLAAIHPSLAGAGVMARGVASGRAGHTTDARVCLALLMLSLSRTAGEAIVDRLQMPPGWAAVVSDTVDLRERISGLAEAAESNSRLYEYLSLYDVSAVRVWSLAAPDTRTREALALYLDRLRHVRPALNGRDLMALGVPQGPAVGAMLARLRSARLEGAAEGRAQETELVRAWLAKDAGRSPGSTGKQ